MEIVFKMVILLDQESNSDKEINNCVVQAGEAASGFLVYKIRILDSSKYY